MKIQNKVLGKDLKVGDFVEFSGDDLFFEGQTQLVCEVIYNEVLECNVFDNNCGQALITDEALYTLTDSDNFGKFQELHGAYER